MPAKREGGFSREDAVVLTVVGLLGCEKAPQMEMDSAKVAVEKARGAEATQYAAESFETLKDSLKAGLAEVEHQDSRFVLMRDYKNARATLAWVDRQSEMVITRARENKARIRKETRNVLQTAEVGIDSAAALVVRAPRGKGSEADIALYESAIQDLRIALQEGERMFEGEKFQNAQQVAESVQLKTRELQQEVSAAITRYEELMAKARRRR